MRDITFVPQVNVVWGASNAGKSFLIRSLDYMCGAGKSLPSIKQTQGFDACWLEFDLPKSGRTTFSRSLSGGEFYVFSGDMDDALKGIVATREINATHSPKSESLSSLLLSELGVGEKRIMRNLEGEKSAFTFRFFATYLFTEETPMMAEWSPIKVAPQSSPTLDKNVLKFILTGVDDSAIVETQSVADQRTANAGKVEIIEELLAATNEELKALFPDDENIGELQLSKQENDLSKSIEEHYRTLVERQTELDKLQLDRRNALSAQQELQDRIAEIGLTLERFVLLANMYDSDAQRLEALEEGAAALMAGASRPCPLCGAEPGDQHKTHGLDHIERSQRAVRAEISKIRVERVDLGKATASLQAEQDGLTNRSDRMSASIREMGERISSLQPLEAKTRETYEDMDHARQRIRNGLALLTRIDKLNVRLGELARFRPRSTPRSAISIGVGGVVGHEFAQIVQEILHAWHFPGDPVVSFDNATHDILIDGRDRRSNGKGIRALMNAAFKIGVFAYCERKSLPHPGIVVLDSPLLSYRDPHTSKHGELGADEAALAKTGLNRHFYEYALRLAKTAQIIIVENDPPPFDLGEEAKVSRFVGELGVGGRPGLL